MANWEHFNLPGHFKDDFKCTLMEKITWVDPEYGREREKLHTRKFITYYDGPNKEQGVMPYC